MEKKYVRKPFDIELAKKIQSGEVEGRIVTSNGIAARILSADFRGMNGCGVVYAEMYEDGEELGLCNITGCGSSGLKCLFIELPEEEQSKHEIEPLSEKSAKEVKYVLGEVARFAKDLYDACKEGLSDTSSYLHEQPKHEFQPFEQVLVRSKECRQYIWQAAFYSHFEKSEGEDFHVTTAGDRYLEGEIVPYAGHEHLVGTSDKPKEE